MNFPPPPLARTKRVRGLHPRAVNLLLGKPVVPTALKILRGVLPARQIAMAKLMVSMNAYSKVFAQALLRGTPPNQLLKGNTKKEKVGIPAVETTRIENEMKALERDFGVIESRYGQYMLDLTVIQAYVRRLLQNRRIAHYLRSNHPDLFSEIEAALAPL